MIDHPSCFWDATKRLLLIVYVDDLLLAGKAELHAPFWELLSKQIKMEPPEELDRYLGRHHLFEEIDALPYDLIEHFTSPIEA